MRAGRGGHRLKLATPSGAVTRRAPDPPPRFRGAFLWGPVRVDRGPAYLSGLDAILAQERTDAMVFGHAGDGNDRVNRPADVGNGAWEWGGILNPVVGVPMAARKPTSCLEPARRER